MQYTIAHELPGRLRLRPAGQRINQAGLIEALQHLTGVTRATVAAQTGSVVVEYGAPASREAVLEAVLQAKSSSRALPPAMQNEPGEPTVKNPLPGRIFSSFMPAPIRMIFAIERSLPYLGKGAESLFKGRLDLDVLDASALAVCLLRRDFRAVSTITFFFALGEFLAEWTRKRSRASLAESLALNIEHVWVRQQGEERQIAIGEVTVGDEVIVRAGAVIPVDGTVIDGEALVNQASMTGEPLPVRRSRGSSVYAGTTLAEGELLIRATKVGSDMRIASIVRFIEDSEQRKAGIQGRYERIADAIVPYNFLLAGLVFVLTRDPIRAGSVLLVDYSCGIRLGTPLVILSAMRESAQSGALIKGGKYLEALAEADAVIFDKTGTLTEARPIVADVVPFGDYQRDTVLRLAACLEEHFAHPVGQAVVRAAEERNLAHREEHAEVEFVVAHGIASRLGEQRVLVGSEHFIVDDEGIAISAAQRAVIDQHAAQGRSVLYLAIGGELAGIILIEDKIRADARDIVSQLRADGVRRIVMLTGDGPLTAQSIATQAGIDEFRAQMLPEGKAAVVADLQRQGYRVLMLGDGMNDSPALSAADVGVAMADGADIAREVADVVLTSGQLADLLRARRLSQLAMQRIKRHFQTSVGFNTLFLAGGLTGVLTPGLSALLHNATTAGIAVSSMRPLLPAVEAETSLIGKESLQ